MRQQPEREGDKAEPHPAPAPDGLVRGCGGPGGMPSAVSIEVAGTRLDWAQDLRARSGGTA